jgi:hypothetical protein
MNGSVIQTMILKDLRLHRTHIVLSLIAGVLAIAVLQFGSDTSFMLGTVWFFISLIVLGSMLPVSNVINERKKQSAVFLMSLPVSAIQYATSKLVSTIGMFLVPWLTLVVAGSAFLFSHRDVPHGIIPLTLVLFLLPLVGFFMIAATALISETEGWTIAATVVCNSTYGLAWYFIIREPAINSTLKSPVAVWSPLVLMILGGEVGAVLLILGITYYLQSQKREFV